jgi:hypothetical protein
MGACSTDRPTRGSIEWAGPELVVLMDSGSAAEQLMVPALVCPDRDDFHLLEQQAVL